MGKGRSQQTVWSFLIPSGIDLLITLPWLGWTPDRINATSQETRVLVWPCLQISAQAVHGNTSNVSARDIRECLFLLFLISVPSSESWSCALHCNTLELALISPVSAQMWPSYFHIKVDLWLVRAMLLVGKAFSQSPLFDSNPAGEGLNWGRDVQCVLPTLIQMLSALDPGASKVQQMFRETLNKNL